MNFCPETTKLSTGFRNARREEKHCACVHERSALPPAGASCATVSLLTTAGCKPLLLGLVIASSTTGVARPRDGCKPLSASSGRGVRLPHGPLVPGRDQTANSTRSGGNAGSSCAGAGAARGSWTRVARVR